MRRSRSRSGELGERVRVFITASLLFAGCTFGDDSDAHMRESWHSYGHGVTEFRDDVHKVTCWAFREGISCLRDEPTNKESGK